MSNYHFADEWGDPGLRSPHSSSHFIIVLVQLPERSPISPLTVLRAERKLSSDFEFKFHRTDGSLKDAFFSVIKPLDFQVRAIVLDKTRKQRQFVNSDGPHLVADMLAELVFHPNSISIVQDILVLDGATPSQRRLVRLLISQHCRTTDRTRPFKKIISSDSASEDGLQIADMVVGAIARSIVNSEKRHMATFSDKIVNLVQLGDKTPPAIP